MKIKTLFHGILGDWLGVAEAEFVLPHEATLADLLSEIRKIYGPNMPPQFKIKDQSAFEQAFWAVRSSGQSNEYSATLNDGEKIQFFLPLAGG